MLSLTKKTGYGLIAMASLAQLGPGELLSARQIAERTGMPPSLVTNALKSLCASGYVNSVRGAHGGYKLACHPDRINLGDLIADIEGPVRLTECVMGRRAKRQAANCELSDRCPIAEPIRRVHEKLRDFLKNVTLAEIVESAKPVPKT